MGTTGDPICAIDHPQTAMAFRTLHTESSRPDEVMALYVCPLCGSERRLLLAGAAV